MSQLMVDLCFKSQDHRNVQVFGFQLLLLSPRNLLVHQMYRYDCRGIDAHKVGYSDFCFPSNLRMSLRYSSLRVTELQQSICFVNVVVKDENMKLHANVHVMNIA